MTYKESALCTSRQLVIFARAPRYGRVKTRLAADIGKLPALQFYRHNLKALTNSLQTGPWHLQFAVYSKQDAQHPIFSGLPTIVQPSGNLGDRMRGVLNQFREQPCLIVGSDIPFIEVRHIEKAFQTLSTRQFVFGPATDGGYWLVGCAPGDQLHQQFMHDVRWSTPNALTDTIATLPSGSQFALIDKLFDIDNGDSYQKYLQHITDQQHLPK